MCSLTASESFILCFLLKTEGTSQSVISLPSVCRQTGTNGNGDIVDKSQDTVTPDVHCIAAHGAAVLHVAFLFVSMLTHVT